jgi:ankyrin repeat protein
LNNVATSVLWNTLYNNPRRCKEVLLWSVEHGRNDLVKDLLDRKTSPNFLYFSSLLGSRLRDVLTAQGRRGAVGPRHDRKLDEEIFREKYCRSGVIRNRVRKARSKAGLSLQITDDDMDWNLAHAWYKHTCSLSHFGISEGPEANDRQYWYWAPIHLAAMTYNNTALRMLLDKGADIDAQCSGLCDCAAPAMGGDDYLEESVAPHRDRSVWTALHVAMCSGNEEAARQLVSKGASINVGSLTRQPYSPHRKSRLAITAFHDAAWLGSVRMCRLLLDEPLSKPFVNVRNRRQQSALHYAAAGGHIRTVGRFLLENGATFHFYEPHAPPTLMSPIWDSTRFDPLRQLCTMCEFADARWLVRFCKKLWPDRSATVLYTRALASLCVLQPAALFSRLSLRQQQDRFYELTPDEAKETYISRKQAVERSQHQRVLLARTLLGLGADPNELQWTCFGGLPVAGPRTSPAIIEDHYRTALQLAAMSGFAKMAKLLLKYGADANYDKAGPSIHKVDSAPRPLKELPLMSAVDTTLRLALAGQDDLNLVRTLLKATSMVDRGDQSVLLTLQSIRARHPPHRAVEKVWLSIAEMALSHGAATATTDRRWEKIVQGACVPGSLAYCKMLEAARPIRGFSWTTHWAMVQQAIFGSDGRYPEGKGTPEDLELVYWALRQCLNSDRRMTRFRSAFPSLIERARKEGRNEMADVVEEFITEMPDAATPVKKREVSPELGMLSPLASETETA